MVLKSLVIGFSGLLMVLWSLDPVDNYDGLGTAQLMPQKPGCISATSEDSLIFVNLMKKAIQENWTDRESGEVMILVARTFEGTPYVAATLEERGPEKLVVNLRELDCTTYAENVLAIAYCVRSRETGFDHFLKRLRLIRYRNGVLNKYPSRLHYFTDWLVNNRIKGILDIVSDQIGNAPFSSVVNFMSQHPDSYPKLKSNPQFVEEIAGAEKDISGFDLKYITGDHIEKVAGQIKDGDLIAFCSSIPGLDVSHVAIAMHLNEELHFIHASLSGKQVEVSPKTLSEFVTESKSIYGILVGRAK